MVYRELLKSHIKWNQFLLLPILSVHDNPKSSPIYKYIWRFLQNLTDIIEIIGFYFSLMAYPLVKGDMNIFCGWCSGVVHSGNTILKVIFLRVYNKDILAHFEEISCNLIELDSSMRFFHFHHYNSRYVRFLQMGHTLMMGLATSLYFGQAIVNSLIKCEPNGDRFLPVFMGLPIDLQSCTAFQLSVFFQSICFYCYNLKMIAIDYMILGFIIFHTIYLKFLKISLMELTDKDYNNDQLRVWVDQHQKAHMSAVNFQKLLTKYLFIEYTYVIAHTCLPAFVITSTVSWTFQQKVALVVMVGGGLLILFVLSAAGDILCATAEEISKVPWSFQLCSNPKFRVTFMMLKYLQRKPLLLHIGTLFPLCCPTYLSISKAIVTYYMALNEIQALKTDH